jgi:hypothetical protein
VAAALAELLWSHEARFRQVRGPTKHVADRCVVARSMLQNARSTLQNLHEACFRMHEARFRQVRGRTKHASDRCVVPRSTLQTGAWSHEALFRMHEARFRTCTKHASDRCVVPRSTLQTGAWSHEARFRQVRGPTKHVAERMVTCTKHASERMVTCTKHASERPPDDNTTARSTLQTGAWRHATPTKHHETRFRTHGKEAALWHHWLHLPPPLPGPLPASCRLLGEQAQGSPLGPPAQGALTSALD